jgi:hypothetical protein
MIVIGALVDGSLARSDLRMLEDTARRFAVDPAAIENQLAARAVEDARPAAHQPRP